MSDLKAYLDLKRRSGELGTRIAAYVQEGLLTGESRRTDEEIAARKELGEVLKRRTKMEAEAGFVAEFGRIQAVRKEN